MGRHQDPSLAQAGGLLAVLALLLDVEVLGQLLHEVALDLQAVVVVQREEPDDVVHILPLSLHALAEPETILLFNEREGFLIRESWLWCEE